MVARNKPALQAKAPCNALHKAGIPRQAEDIDAYKIKTELKRETITNLSLVGHNLDEVVCPHIVHVWDKNGQEVRAVVLGVDVFLHPIVPVFPFTYG